MLHLDNINVSYGDIQVLHDVRLMVEKGEIVVLIGSNFAGKTTLMKTISGLLEPTSGTITFLDKRIDREEPYDIVNRGIGLVPEGRHLFPYMTVLENLELGAYTDKARKRKADTLEWVFRLFPILQERKKQFASTLSGGEQQMLAIGRALMLRPHLLMLDEPSLGLAPMLVQRVFQTVEEINKEGVTILLIEQNVRQALLIASRGYVLEIGRIILEGSSQELLESDKVKKSYLGM